MDILIKILQFFLSFSLLVLVHEFGHFIFGRIFGVRVDRFKVFFGKSIVSFRRGETEYALGWIPFGGYCKLNGMIDESLDTAHLASEPQPYEFRSKPAWQRLLIMAGGVIMNIVLAFVIYTGILYTWGEAYISTQDARYGYVFSDDLKTLGFEDGDRILTVDGKEINDVDRLRMAFIIDQGSVVKFERDGKPMEIYLPKMSIAKMVEGRDILSPRYPFRVAEAVDGGGAQAAGIEPGDRLVSLDGEPMMFFDQYLNSLGAFAGQTVAIGVERDSAGVTVNKTLDVAVSEHGTIGAALDIFALTPVYTRSYTFWQSIPAGFKRIGTEVRDYWKQLKMIATPKTEAFKKVSGPLGIGNIFPKTWNWGAFWNITALLSIALAIMNLLPIPGLDGGHILFTLVEMITGRKPGDKFIMYAQVVGMLIIVTLMVLVTGNDIYNIFVK